MSRTTRMVLLAALSLGVFLVGVELMITAVALPQIMAELADNWLRLREGSWIVNGYLVAYVAVMPLAGRAADRFNLPTLFALALVVFAVGSLLCGAATTLEWLIAARVVQGLGAGAIVPLATAGASIAFEGHTRARAIGVVGALTFLGMAAGPFVGATIIELLRSWRWVFYLPVPFALLTVVYTWAAASGWPRGSGKQGLDAIGAALFTAFAASGLVALTFVGTADATLPVVLAAVSAAALVAFVLWTWRAKWPFVDLRLFRDRTFAGAVLLSLLTGYPLATAIIGGAVFVDRVRYAGPAEQQLALGGLAAAVALGALGSGFALRRIGVVWLSLIGLIAAVAGLGLLSTATPASSLGLLVAGLSVFGLGFGLTVTARSSAAVESAGRQAFGVASGIVTVARMLGMGIGLAALTAFGSNRIESLSLVLVDQQARDAILPESLRGLPLQNTFVVDALERWAAGEAAAILSTLFLVAAGVTAVAIVPTLAMRNRPSARQEEGSIDALSEASQPGVAI